MIAASDLPTGLRGRVIALSLLGVLIGLAYITIVAPLIDVYRSGEETLADRQLLAPKLDHLVAELPSLRARLASLQSAGATREMTLEGASDALASANLQSRLEQSATESGVTITSTEATGAEDRGPYRKIGLRLAVSGKYEAIVKLIAAIEETKPPLILDGLQLHGLLRAVQIRTDQPLEARFEVYGLRMAGAAAGQTQ